MKLELGGCCVSTHLSLLLVHAHDGDEHLAVAALQPRVAELLHQVLRGYLARLQTCKQPTQQIKTLYIYLSLCVVFLITEGRDAFH